MISLQGSYFFGHPIFKLKLNLTDVQLENSKHYLNHLSKKDLILK